jgi:hypothetical protein
MDKSTLQKSTPLTIEWFDQKNLLCINDDKKGSVNNL